MIRDRAAWERWETDYMAQQPPDFWKNLQAVEELYELARTLGVLPAADVFEGLEVKIRLAKVINALV